MKDEQLSQAVKLAQTASHLLIVVTIFAASIVAMSTIRSCNDCPPCPPCARIEPRPPGLLGTGSSGDPFRVEVRDGGLLGGSAERAP